MYASLFPTPLHPTPYTLHPTPYTPPREKNLYSDSRASFECSQVRQRGWDPSVLGRVSLEAATSTTQSSQGPADMHSTGGVECTCLPTAPNARRCGRGGGTYGRHNRRDIGGFLRTRYRNARRCGRGCGIESRSSRYASNQVKTLKSQTVQKPHQVPFLFFT